MVSDRRNMTDFVKVLDFGIAKLRRWGHDAYKTAAGVVCGHKVHEPRASTR